MENMNNQGKTQQQYEDSARVVGYSIIGIIILLILATLLGSCGSTKPPKKCCDKEHVITEWDGDKQINWYSKRTK